MFRRLVHAGMSLEIIRHARRKLGKRLREYRDQGAREVYMDFPAKLVVSGNVVADEFPEWHRILQYRQDRDQRNATVVESRAGPSAD